MLIASAHFLLGFLVVQYILVIISHFLDLFFEMRLGHNTLQNSTKYHTFHQHKTFLLDKVPTVYILVGNYFDGKLACLESFLDILYCWKIQYKLRTIMIDYYWAVHQMFSRIPNFELWIFTNLSSEIYPKGNFWCDPCNGGQNLPPHGWNRVKVSAGVSENLGGTAVP